MAREFEIRVATAGHAEQLAAVMRQEDEAEVAASCGLPPLEALRRSMQASDFTHALLLDGEVAALWGVVPVGGTLVTGPAAGIAWALTGRAVDRHARLFARLSLLVVSHLERLEYPVLANMVDARYAAALRWLRWLGFAIGPAEPFGAEGRPFHPAVLRSVHG